MFKLIAEPHAPSRKSRRAYGLFISVLIALGMASKASADGYPLCPGYSWPSTTSVVADNTRSMGSDSLRTTTGETLKIDTEGLREMMARRSGRGVTLPGASGLGSISPNVGIRGLNGVSGSGAPGAPSATLDVSRLGSAEVLVQRVGGSTTSVGSVESLGLSPGAKRLSSELTGVLPKYSVGLTKWNSVVASLESLPHARQERIAALAKVQPTFSLDRKPETDAQVVVERALSLSRVFSLERSLRPETAHALFKVKLDEMPDATLLNLSNRPDIRAIGMRMDGATRAAQEMGFLKRDHNVDMIGIGEGVPAGGLGEVPAGVAARVVDAGGGQWCVRPTQPDDYRLDPKRMTVGQSWDPTAFPDVALLLTRKPGTGLASISVCTAVRVSNAHLLSAAHCLSSKGTGDRWEKKNFGDSQWEAIALLPIPTVAKKYPQKCFDTPATCGFYVAKLKGVASFPEGTSWVGDVPKPDIGLLEISFSKEAHKPTTAAVGDEASFKEITLAGYGDTNAGGVEYSGYLQVGWQRRPPELQDSVFVWSVDPRSGFAGACEGDSGGAVFDGSVAGPKDARRLAGLISFGVGPKAGSGVDRCMRMSTGVATRLSLHAKWICKASKGEALGCLPDLPSILY